MSEWWTYSLTDFLLFSPRTYHRLFALYNEAVWPAHVLALALVAAILLLLHTRSGGRPVAAILAVLWAWIAVAFHAERYATINWAATYFAWAFAAQAALLMWAALVRPAFDMRADGSTATRIALAIFVFCTLVQPLIAFVASGDLRRSEIFGLAPDPTAAATLALLAMTSRPPRYLFVIPVLWCVFTSLTLVAMEEYVGLAMPIAGALALLVAAWKTAPHEAS